MKRRTVHNTLEERIAAYVIIFLIALILLASVMALNSYYANKLQEKYDNREISTKILTPEL